MKLVAFGVAVVLLLICNGFGSHARSIAPARVTSLYKSIGEAKQNSVGDILRDCSESVIKLIDLCMILDLKNYAKYNIDH
jgi:hypothetical protein